MEIWLLRMATGIVLAVIGIQDLRLRGVSWYLFIFLVLLLRMDSRTGISDIMVNISFIGLVFALLFAWFYLRTGRIINIFNAHIGLGDLLFLLCLAVYFTPLAFFLFYLFSLLIVTAGTCIYLVFQDHLQGKKEGFTVPLAGLQSLLFFVALCVEWSTGVFGTLVIPNLFQDPV